MRAKAATVVLCTLATATALAGCAGGADGADAVDGLALAAGKGVLRGLVVDQAIRPLAAANVTVSGEGLQVEATTDEGGLFGFSDLAPGLYTVTVAKPYYGSYQQAATVLADVEEPELVRFQLVLDASSAPFTTQYKWDAFVECAHTGFNTCSAANLYPCIVLSQAGQACPTLTGDRSFLFETAFWTDLQRIPDFIQFEAVWEESQALADGMLILYNAGNQSEIDQASTGPGLASGNGHSPHIEAANRSVLEEAEFGTDRGLIVQMVGGAPEAVEPLFDPLPPPANGWSYLAGVVINQRITLVFTTFYGYAPPEDWSFVATGTVPSPPQ